MILNDAFIGYFADYTGAYSTFSFVSYLFLPRSFVVHKILQYLYFLSSATSPTTRAPDICEVNVDSASYYKTCI